MSVDKLRQRGYAFSCVLNDNGANCFHDIRYIVHKMQDGILNIRYIACILHDNDVDDFNQKKVNHYHLVFTIDCNMSLRSVLSHIVKTFSCNENQVSIEKCSDVCSQVRYLVHMDDLDKYQYLPFDVETNNQNLTMEYFAKEVNINDCRDVDAICDKYQFNLRKIAHAMGDVQFKKWLWYITATKRDLYR